MEVVKLFHDIIIKINLLQDINFNTLKISFNIFNGFPSFFFVYLYLFTILLIFTSKNILKTKDIKVDINGHMTP